MVRGEDALDSLLRARAQAEEGRLAYPESLGGQTCLNIVQSIEAPDYQVEAMAADGPRRPSIAVTHRNLRSVYFRSYSLDLLAIVAASRDYSLFPDATALRTMLRERSPEAAWSEDLPPTPDYRSHRTFVTPPLDRPGLHAVVVSASPDFGEGANRVVAAPIVISDLVLLT